MPNYTQANDNIFTARLILSDNILILQRWTLFCLYFLLLFLIYIDW